MVGLFPANRVGDDIEIYRDETRTHVLTVSHHLRQQTEKVGFANYCLADFVAPKLSGKADYIGAFAVTGGWKRTRWRMPMKRSMMTITRS